MFADLLTIPLSFPSRVHPVAGRACVALVLGTDEGLVLDAGDVVGVGACIDGAGLGLLGQPHDGARSDQLLHQFLGLFRRTVAVVDRVGSAELDDRVEPGEQLGVVRFLPGAGQLGAGSGF